MVETLSLGIPMVILGMVLLWCGKKIHDFTTDFDDNHHLFNENNAAFGIYYGGYCLGVLLAICGVMSGPSRGLLQDIIEVTVYGVYALLLMRIAVIVTDKFILRKFDIYKKILDERNVSVATVVFGVNFAVGMILRGVMIGESQTLLYGIYSVGYYFILSQIMLVMAVFIYEKVVKYIHDEIGNNNLAAGIELAGVVSALGVILSSAVSGGGSGIQSSFMATLFTDTISFFEWATIGLVILILFSQRVVAEHILVPGHKLHQEISVDKNIGAGVMSLVAYHFTAWLLFFAL